MSRRARYAILGAMIGDAAGTTFEFQERQTVAKWLNHYDNFSHGLIGKGPFNLVPGQFTDDSEMALSIMYVIASNGVYDQKLVANAYHQWYKSNPFDIGNTTQNAIKYSTVDTMIDAAKKYNSESLSNGFLMRLYGLVAMLYWIDPTELVQLIGLDVKLTHSHPEAAYMGTVYGLMLRGAIDGYNANQVYAIGKNYKNSPLINAIYQAVETDSPSFTYNGIQYKLADADTKMIGFVGYAFWLLLKCLKKFTSYDDAIIYVIKHGGDTDTNACIVGAVMGALYPDTVNKTWINNVTRFQSRRFNDYPISNPVVWTKWLP